MNRPSHQCLLCGTQYYAPGICDFCDPDVELTEIKAEPRRSGYVPPMLQDDCRALSKWLAAKPGARLLAAEAATAIGQSLGEGESK